MNDVVYFSLNNWFCGRDYPKDGRLKEFVEAYKFSDDAWCKENKLCVLNGNFGMPGHGALMDIRKSVHPEKYLVDLAVRKPLMPKGKCVLYGIDTVKAL